MREKEEFIEPEMEIIVFPAQSIVVTSDNGIELPDDEW